MGAIWLTRGQLIGETTELVGYKAGLALSRERLGKILGDQYQDLFLGDDADTLRVRSETFEGFVRVALYGVGYLSSPSGMPPMIRLYHKFKDDPEQLQIAMGVLELFVPALQLALEIAKRTETKSIDPTPFLEDVRRRYGPHGALMACELLEGVNESLFASPWCGIRRVDWDDKIALEALFKSESLSTQYGSFIDQRYVDFLARNFSEVDDMNWRKFEGLTAEFFSRIGWQVEIGPGRDDGGIDVRVWLATADASDPPTIIIQCKRQRDKIEKAIVKALWADIQDEKAHSGLIVTTSSLAPGARRVVTARSYPILEADRNELRAWVESMRTPGTGAYLAG